MQCEENNLLSKRVDYSELKNMNKRCNFGYKKINHEKFDYLSDHLPK